MLRLRAEGLVGAERLSNDNNVVRVRVAGQELILTAVTNKKAPHAEAPFRFAQRQGIYLRLKRRLCKLTRADYRLRFAAMRLRNATKGIRPPMSSTSPAGSGADAVISVFASSSPLK